MWYYRRLPDGLVVLHTRPEHAEQLEELQRDLLSDARRCRALQGGALPEASRAVSRRPVRRARRRSRGWRHDDAPPAFRFRPHRSHVRRHHPGRLAHVARTGRRLALRRRRRRPSGVSRSRARDGAVRGAAGSRLAARAQGPGHRRDDPRATAPSRIGMSAEEYYRGCRRGSHQGLRRCRCSSASASSRARCSPTT